MYTCGGIVHIKIFSMHYKIAKVLTLTIPKSYVQ